jgi:phage FluMu protein Com
MQEVGLKEVRCPHCNRFVCESSGEVKRDMCEKCGKPIHVVVTTKGIIDLLKIK